MFSFASVGHAIASGIENVAKGFEWLTTEAAKVESSEKVVESITAIVPGAAAIVGLEKLGYASLGVLIAVVKAGDDALKQNLINAGADESFIQQIEQLIQQFPTIISQAEASFKSQSTAATTAAKQASLASVVKALPPKASPPTIQGHVAQPQAATSAVVK
jgi:hypothetical protein